MVAWGTVPDWTVAVGTLGTFATGGVLLWRQRRESAAAAQQDRAAVEQTRMLAAEQTRLAEDRRREQATGVSVWPDIVEIDIDRNLVV